MVAIFAYAMVSALLMYPRWASHRALVASNRATAANLGISPDEYQKTVEQGTSRAGLCAQLNCTRDCAPGQADPAPDSKDAGMVCCSWMQFLMLREIGALFRDMDLDYFLTLGSLLGAARAVLSPSHLH